MLPVFLIGFAFLALMALLWVALVSGLRRGGGERRALGGFLLFAGLGFVGLLSFVFTAVLLVLSLGFELIERGPVRSIEVVRTALTSAPLDPTASALEIPEGRHAGLDPAYPVHVLVEFRGKIRRERLREWLRHETDGNVELVSERTILAEGETLTLLDFGLRVSRAELRDFERRFERELPFFELPEGLRIQVGDPSGAVY